MITFSGCHVTKEYGVPTVRDIAVQLMRIVRFSGSGRVFWPVGMHSLLVADLVLQTEMVSEAASTALIEVYALLHDAAEACVGEVPKPMKTNEARAVEHAVQVRIYASLGIPEPPPAIHDLIKRADLRAAIAEGSLGCCGRGFAETQTGYFEDKLAMVALSAYLKSYDPIDAIYEDGRWARELEQRLRKGLRAVHASRSAA